MTTEEQKLEKVLREQQNINDQAILAFREAQEKKIQKAMQTIAALKANRLEFNKACEEYRNRSK